MSLAGHDDRFATRVGGVTLVALVAGICFVVFLLGRIEVGSHVRVQVYFEQTGGLREGAPLISGGRRVGEVEAIALAPKPVAGAPDPLDGHDGVIAVVAIDARLVDRVPAAGDIFVSSKGALSERYLEVAPPRLRHPDGTSELAPPGPAVHDGQALRGIDPPSLDRVLQRTWDNLNTASSFLDDVRPEARELAKQLTALADNLPRLSPTLTGTATLAVQASQLLDTARTTWNVGLGGRSGVDRMAAVIAQARITIAQGKATLAALDPRATSLGVGIATARARIDAKSPELIGKVELAIDRAQAAFAKIEPMLATAQDIADRLARGEGSIGRLMQDPEFPEDAKDLGKILKRQPWKIIGHPNDH